MPAGRITQHSQRGSGNPAEGRGVEFPSIFWGVIIWMIIWGIGGSIAIRYRYLHKDLDTSNANFVGAMVGAATGPVGLVPLWMRTPELTNKLIDKI